MNGLTRKERLWRRWAELCKNYDDAVYTLCFEPFDEFSLDVAQEFRAMALEESEKLRDEIVRVSLQLNV